MILHEDNLRTHKHLETDAKINKEIDAFLSKVGT